MSKKKRIKVLCGLTGREKCTLPSMLLVFLESSQLSPFPVVTEASDTHARVDCGQNIATDCAEPGLFWCRADRQTGQLLWWARPPDRSGPAKLSRLLQLVCACLHQLRIWLCYIWQWPSPTATSPSQSWKIDEQPERGAVSQVQGTANGTSRHILTGPVSSWLNRSSSNIVQSSHFFLPGCCGMCSPTLSACVS